MILAMALLLTGVDHILLGVPDLPSGMKAFEQATGVKPVYGGKHPGRGTENALVSLGDGIYLELIAPQQQPDSTNDFTRQLAALKKPTLVGWAAHTNDIAALREKLSSDGFTVSDLRPGSRLTPAGTRLEWTTLSIDKPEIATAPFFIQWGAKTVHPSQSSPGSCTVKSFEVTDPQSKDLSRLLNDAAVALGPSSSDKPHMRLVVRCGEREAVFTSD